MSRGYEEQIDYAWIKQAAKSQGVSVNDLIVLAPQNDPFYTGTPNERALGEWFAWVWQQLGGERAHIRRVHYYLVLLGSVTFPNGKPYENTIECWDLLNMASKAARYLQLVDPAAFDDRRTPEVRLYAQSWQSSAPYVWVHQSSSKLEMKLPAFPDLPRFSLDGYAENQPYHLEVWCEKSTMNDVLAPLCQRYGANLQTGAGEMSITATLALVHRLREADKPARILYVSDFDPAGQSMPVAVSRKVEYFVRTLGLDLDIRLFPVVLTLDQVQAYQLPRTPIKETERRRGGFEQRHGEGAVELDALEALYPGELERVLTQYLEAYYDVTLQGRLQEQERALRERLGGLWQDVMRSYQPDVEAIRQEYEMARQEVEGRLAAVGERMRALCQVMGDELSQQVDGVTDAYPVPLAYQGQELGTGLYDSERSYLEQVDAYKQFQGRS
jgi:hypothetical protein